MFRVLSSQVQEGCRRLPKSKHGTVRDRGSDEGDYEEHGQKAAGPSEKPENQQPEQEGRGRARERPKLSCGILLALLQLVLLVLLGVLRGRRRFVSAQPQGQ